LAAATQDAGRPQEILRPCKTLLLWAANTAAGLVLILLLLDPTRDLRPVFVLLAVAVGALFAWRFWPRRQ
jgi:hypothetical protein